MKFKTYHKAKQGIKHKRYKTLCQDSVAKGRIRSVYTAALADGAGSASHARLGSQIASKTICTYVSHNFETLYTLPIEEVKTKIIKHIQEAIRDNSEEVRDIRNMATTLLFVAIHKSRYIVAQIGDGCILESKNGTISLVFDQDDFEFSNETIFITNNAEQVSQYYQIKRGDIGDIDSFILTSDGLEDFFVKDNQFNETVKKHIDTLMDKIEVNRELRMEILFNNVQNTNPQFNDDMSLSIITNDKYQK